MDATDAQQLAKTRGRMVVDTISDGGWPVLVFDDGSAVRFTSGEEVYADFIADWQPERDAIDKLPSTRPSA